MAQAVLKWVNESKNNPGFSVYHATPDRDPNVLYVIRQKRAVGDFKPTGWRVFMRSKPTEPLRTIFHDEKMGPCKTFIAELEDINAKAAT